MSQTLTIGAQTVTVDIESMGKDLCDLHNKDQGIKARLALGMLDAKLCATFKDNLTKQIKGQFDDPDNDLFSKRINDFIDSVNFEIACKVYKYADMVTTKTVCEACDGKGYGYWSCCNQNPVDEDVPMCPVCHEHVGEEECTECEGKGEL